MFKRQRGNLHIAQGKILIYLNVLIYTSGNLDSNLGETLKTEAGKKNHLKFTFFSFRDKTLLWKDYFSALNKPLSYVYTKCFYSYK